MTPLPSNCVGVGDGGGGGGACKGDFVEGVVADDLTCV